MHASQSVPAPALLLRRMGAKPQGVTQSIACDGSLPMLRFEVEALRGSLVVQLAGIPEGVTSIKWMQNGSPIAGQLGDAIHFAELSADAADVYYAEIQTHTAAIRSQAFLMVVGAGNPLLNVSARAHVSAAKPLIVGFSIGRLPGQTANKRYLLRVIGDSLRKFGVSETLSRPIAALHRGRVKVADLVSTEEDTVLASKCASKAGAFALDPAAKEVSMVIELAPAAYSVVVAATELRAGEVLVEVYELSF
jgi:hypothetical protein